MAKEEIEIDCLMSTVAIAAACVSEEELAMPDPTTIQPECECNEHEDS